MIAVPNKPARIERSSFPVPNGRELENLRKQLEKVLELKGHLTSIAVDFGDNGIPPGVSWKQRDALAIQSAQRIGAEARNRCHRLLDEALSGGYISEEVWAARVDYLNAAVTQSQAEEVLKDLHEVHLKPKPQPVKEKSGSNSGLVKRVAIGLVTVAAGVCIAGAAASNAGIVVALLLVAWVAVAMIIAKNI